MPTALQISSELRCAFSLLYVCSIIISQHYLQGENGWEWVLKRSSTV